MTETSVSLSRKRGGIKGKVTSFLNFLETLKVNKLGGVDDEVILAEVEERVGGLIKCYNEFEVIQGKIGFMLENDKDVEEWEKYQREFDDLYYKTLGRAKIIVNKSKVNKNQLEVESVIRNRPELPSIPIPTFDGVLSDWVEFRDTFISLVHENDSLTDIEKFYYLKGALQGEAKKVVSVVKCTKDNYQIVWDLLSERYDDIPMLVNYYLKLLVKFSPLDKESSLELRSMSDTIKKSLVGLEKLGISVKTWDTLVIYIMLEKLDQKSFAHWQEQKPKGILPTLETFQSFLRVRSITLRDIENNKKENYKRETKSEGKFFQKTKMQKSLVAISSPSCQLCQRSHDIVVCHKFLKLTTYNRYRELKRLGLCLTCFRKGHMSNTCNQIVNCDKCGGRHHSLLHYEKQVSTENASTNSRPEDEAGPSGIQEQVNSALVSATLSECYAVPQNEVLLSTAQVEIVDGNGCTQSCRVLLDNGSQANLITADMCKKLNLELENVSISIVGINQVVSSIKYKSMVKLKSKINDYCIEVSCLVVPLISNAIPNQFINISHLQIPQKIRLADPKFNIKGKIDLLLGSSIFYSLLSIGQIKLGVNQPILQNSRLGWLISGSITSKGTATSTLKCKLATSSIDVQDQLRKFWELEEFPTTTRAITEDDLECERIFVETTNRCKDGKFIVQIPLIESPLKLGGSRELAVRRFLSLEKRLGKNPIMKEMYTQFMNEYRDMGHMSLVTSDFGIETISYFLPHHGVLNENSTTTKLRVVFNGSAATDSGISFNDIQYAGPKIQEDLWSILIRFRQHPVVVSADIEKMYRMILVKPCQRSLQNILWRSDPEEELQEYTLNTVTYGTKSAPFLAIRCLKQLGLDNKETHPRASEVILHEFYVDDMLSGAKTAAEAVILCKQVDNILKSGGFRLRKWMSNDPTVLQEIDDSYDMDKGLGEKDQIKTLGLYWVPKCDTLRFSVNFDERSKYTKRLMLSQISRIFDPLGLLGPCVILAKVLLQRLWEEHLAWDDELPNELGKKWKRLQLELNKINSIQIPRNVICKEPLVLELHGFSDASIIAYGACLYVRSIAPNGIHVNLLCSKVRVAPLKSLTIPRLELSGALVLAQLVAKVVEHMNINFRKIILWSDSTVVLGWIKMSPGSLHIFVGNRISQIQNLTKDMTWYHIKSENNPADLLSRGVLPSNLMDSNVWWHGPEWLQLKETQWPAILGNFCQDLPEVKLVVQPVQVEQIEPFELFDKISNFNKLRRVIAWCLRWRSKVRKPYLTSDLLSKATIVLVTIAQNELFGKEIENLKTNRDVSKNLRKLNPFLDFQGVLRVGGRLQLSALSYNQKHPILLSSKHKLTELLFEYEHVRLLHVGPQTLLNTIRQTYWVLGGRNLAKKVSYRCITCFKANPKISSQQMGILPAQRVLPSFPFSFVGIHYAGPIFIKHIPGRGAKLIKCWISLFICMSTKAIHLEVVSDLTTEAFIACFRRFVSRRGKPLEVFSDNGSNFVGANRELLELGVFIRNNNRSLASILENEGISWKFIPPNSPNFGGLWEAGIRSCKERLKRIMAHGSLTFEGLLTLLTQIEAVLNSRPLFPMSSSPNDLDVLTPSHFLIGRQLVSLPDPDVRSLPSNRLSQYQNIQALLQQFWDRWSSEYVAELQCRTKWNKANPNLHIDQLVLIKNDNLPPMNWNLGRIIEVYPGPDGLVRVVKLRTNTGEVKRAVSKHCPLPVNE